MARFDRFYQLNLTIQQEKLDVGVLMYKIERKMEVLTNVHSKEEHEDESGTGAVAKSYTHFHKKLTL